MPDPIVDLREKKNGEAPPPLLPVAMHESDTAQKQSLPPGDLREEKDLLSWEALEFEEHPKDEGRWIRTVIGGAIALVLIFLLLKNILGAIVVILGAFTLLLQAFRKPKTLRCRITDTDVAINEKCWTYDELESFWIFIDPVKELSIKMKKSSGQNIKFPLGATDPLRIRSVLTPLLPEVKQQQSALDLFLKRIGY